MMPGPALEILGELLSETQHDAIPPLQVLTNLMATLPQKGWVVHTIAIATSFYRLLMELDSHEAKAFEAANAYEKDPARSGASAVHAAEDRALAVELAHSESKLSLTIL